MKFQFVDLSIKKSFMFCEFNHGKVMIDKFTIYLQESHQSFGDDFKTDFFIC